MKNIWTIMKKELDKIFKYPRMIFATILLPGLMIFLVYSLMGNSADSISSKANNDISNIVIINHDESKTELKNAITEYASFPNNRMAIEWVNDDAFQIENYQDDIKSGKTDLLVCFFEDEDSVNINTIMYGDGSRANSSNALDKMRNAFELYNESITATNPDYLLINDQKDINEKKTQAMSVAMIVPFLIIIFIFAGAMTAGADAIAGEKERGTLATLLVTPIKREEIILGKIFSTTIIAVLNALSSFLGIMLTTLTSKSMFGDGFNYSFGEYMMMFLVIFVMAVFALSLILLVSTFAKTTKEASMLSMPIYIIAMVACVMGMFETEISSEVITYIIPIYNINLCLKSIFMMQINLGNMAITIVSTLLYALVAMYIMSRLFKSERVIYGK